MHSLSRLGPLTLGLIPGLVFSIFGLTLPIHAATIAFGDGLAHAIPGDPAFLDGDGIVLSNASQLAIDGSAVVAGADDTEGIQTTGGPALTSAPGTTAVLRGGTIEGGLATASYPDAFPTSSPIAVGGAGIDQGGDLRIESGVVNGGIATALALPTANRSQADGGPALVVGSGRVVIAQGDFRSGSATTGGSRTNNIARSGDVHVVSEGSTLIIHGGSHVAADATADNSGVSQGDSTAESGHALDIRSGATVIVHGGTFETGRAVAASGGGNSDATVAVGSPVQIEDGARLVVYGGDFARGGSIVAAPGTRTFVPPAAIRLDVTGASTPTRVVLLGGRQSADYGLDIPFTNAHATDARVVIGRADLDGSELDLRLAHPDVTTEILGSNFAMNGSFLEPGPLSATSGTVTVFVNSGGIHSFRFERQNGAPLVLPEPTGALGPALLALAGCAARSRSRGSRASR